MKTNYGTGKVIGGILIGTLFGVALRILFANHKCCKTESIQSEEAKESDKDIREKMKEDANILRRKAKDLEKLAKD
jgi:gas vesicle protein